MAALVARKSRVGTFGIALCFLAALFFVEAKTTWADHGGRSASAISSAKAQLIDSSMKAEFDAESGRRSEHSLIVFTSVFAALIACTLTFPQHQSQTIFAFLPLHVDDGIGHEQSVRPPPAR